MKNKQLQALKDKVKAGELQLSIADGKYLLPDPDRRIVIKQGSKYILIGHRSKKLHRILKRRKIEHLKALLGLECYKINIPAGTDIELLDDTEELARLLNPRPKVFFHRKWLETSESKEASYLREMLPKAEKIS